MANGTIVLLGSLPIERLILDLFVLEFEFSFTQVPSLHAVTTIDQEDIAAVLFNPNNLGLEWEEALRSVLNAFPGAFPILCHGFADRIDWPRMADAGAFHSIPVPFSVAELRQSLGYVWGAQQKTKLISTRKTGGGDFPKLHLVATGTAA
jgi:hypothetical protein